MSRYSKKISPLVFFSFVTVIFTAAWCLIAYESWHGHGHHLLKGAGSAVGVAGYFLLCLSFFLSSRWKYLENWLGGLDRVYRLHHLVGLAGFFLLLFHPWILASKWLPQRVDKFFSYPFIWHGRLPLNFGMLAYWLLVLIIVATVSKLLRYDKWKIVHKCLTLVFIFATLHIFLSTRRFSTYDASLALYAFPMALAVFGIFYKQVYLPFFLKKPTCRVTEVKKLSKNVAWITFSSSQKLEFQPGQYAFFSFAGNFSKEQHPFTLIGQDESHFSILLRARGDFTSLLFDSIQPKNLVSLEGPYGRFDYRNGGPDQIWIAGGVGIAAFLSWLYQFPQRKGRIDFFYCVHQKDEAFLLEKIRRIKRKDNAVLCAPFLHGRETKVMHLKSR